MGGEKRPSTDCLRMHDNYQKTWESGYILKFQVYSILVQSIDFHIIEKMEDLLSLEEMKLFARCTKKKMHVLVTPLVSPFSSAFSPMGGKYVSMCKACGKLRGSGGMLPREMLILDLLLTQFGGIWDCFHTNIIYH